MKNLTHLFIGIVVCFLFMGTAFAYQPFPETERTFDNSLHPTVLKQNISKVIGNSATPGSIHLNNTFAPNPDKLHGFTNPSSSKDILQFTSEGHVLGFARDSVYVAGMDRVLRMEFVGGRLVKPEAEGIEMSWNGAPPLNKVTYSGVWEGVDVVYKKTPGGIMESFYYVNNTDHGLAADSIRLRYNLPISLDGQGNLVTEFENGNMVESAPVAWQEVDGKRKPVAVCFVLHDKKEVGFSIGDYLPGIPVVIDPVLTWNTFLGGSGNDFGLDIAVHGSGNVFVSGSSRETWGDPVRPHAGSDDDDAFVAKLDSNGVLQWNTFLGGSGSDTSGGIAVDGSGNVYVTGVSTATWGEPDLVHGGGRDAFIAKLDKDGVLQWNTFLGGSDTDWGDGGQGIAMDDSDNVYVTGWSRETWGDPVRPHAGSDDDAFVAKLDEDGKLIWNTFLGGSGSDIGKGIVVDDSGNVYVTGWSFDWGEPVREYTTGEDAFVAKLNGSTGALMWNTFLGGGVEDFGLDIALDVSGNVYVVGVSDTSWGNPVRPYEGGYDVFVARLNSTTGVLAWNTFLGGSGSDTSDGIAVDGSGNLYVTGTSTATWGNPVRAYTMGEDAFVAILNGATGALIWNTFLGGSGNDFGLDIAVHGSGNVFVSGSSRETWGNPVRPYEGGYDVFVARLTIRFGSMIINIEPEGARDAGAQWRIKGTSTWYDSGETVPNIPVGTFIIEFKVVPGWRSEGTITVNVEEGKTAIGTGYYFEHATVLPGVMMLLLDDEEHESLKPPIGIGIE